MNRTDRLYAIVETLRAIAPRTRSARVLAQQYEVSVRTIERDISALQQASVPIYADTGRTGGYALDTSMSLPPLNFTPAEAVAVAVALRGVDHTPFGRSARSALRKIMAAMPSRDAGTVNELATRVRFFTAAEAQAAPAVPAVLSDALVHRHVLHLVYQDKQGELTEREVEPLMFLAGQQGWYLHGYCRLRQNQRVFRLDRIVAARDRGEPAPHRPDLRPPSDVPHNIALLSTFD
ncbi:WYL domain-containing protein [Lentzea tibetensis]|uniref:WYL domain-containing protein n=1 Tax=Lentzea tibetensis TaxID=2591470 RepID=A0A563EMJ0_9PSEU|nr:WYL domain-containing protein [Lentzea tibetensis]TWP48419.1 WYL domain-containing protein [Lentzea tibetensis]